MRRRPVVFEGYDGSGKSTLIQGVQAACSNRSVRIIGRKDEPALRFISDAIEDGTRVLPHDTEVLLRIALETERQHIIHRAIETHDLVLVDRGIVSLRSWVDYYRLPRADYTSIFASLAKRSEGAAVVFCAADFETCWNRIQRKGAPSRKELLGKESNFAFYRQYVENVNRFHNDQCVHLTLDTSGQAANDSLQALLAWLAEQGVL